MSSRKNSQKTDNVNKSSKDKINKILDDTISRSKDSIQTESFYLNQANDIKANSNDFFPIVAKRLLKANQKNRETLFQLFKHFKGVEHIKFLQEFIQREIYLPRTGSAILEVLNRSDAILEDGLASRLLDLEHLAQQIKNCVLNEKPESNINIYETLVDEYLQKRINEKQGIICQLIDEAGFKSSTFILQIIEKHEKEGMTALSYIANHAAAVSLNILESVYKKTNRKEILKIIKKTAHVLRQKGFEVPFYSKKEEKDAVYKTVSLPESQAIISSVDPAGNRLIFMVKPVNTYEFKLFNIITSDVNGINDIEVINVFRKECQQFVDKLFASKKTEFLDTTIAAAAFLVEESCRLTEEKNKVISANILQWRRMFSDTIGAHNSPLIYQHFSREETVSKRYTQTQAEELLEKTDIAFWFIASEEAEDLWMKFTNIQHSPLVLSDTVKKQRIHEAVQESASRFFNEERKKIFQRRLEEVAYFLYRKDKKDLAEIALIISSSQSNAGINPEDDQFCLTMIKKSFDFFQSAYKDSERKRHDLISNTE